MSISRKVLSGAVVSILAVVGIEGVTTVKNNVSASVNQVSTITKLQKFTKIKVDDAINSVVIKSGDKYNLTYKGESKNKPNFQVNNGVLEVTTKSHGVFGWLNFNFFSKVTGGTVIIEVPKGKLQKLNIDASNGDVTITNISFEEGTIDTSNGNVNLDNIRSLCGISVNSSNGNINVKNSEFSGYELSTSNGDIKYHGITTSGSFEKNTSSKNVASINTSNGDISIR